MIVPTSWFQDGSRPDAERLFKGAFDKMTTLHPVASSNIAAVGHDPETNELHVKFKSGATHIYSGVTADKHAALMGAESIGKHFHAHIRDKFKQRKIEA